MDFSDERLVNISTQELKTYLSKGLISQEKHNELKSRRRRLQNRKYARKCAKKKQIQISHLQSEIDTQLAELKALTRQRSNLLDAARRYEIQERDLAYFLETNSEIIKVDINGKKDKAYIMPSQKCAHSTSEPNSYTLNNLTYHQSNTLSSKKFR